MAPPLNSWPYSHAGLKPCDNKCNLVNIVDNLRNLGLNFTYIFIILQVIISLSAVSAGPVILSLDYLRGPVATARNIRHLPCISRTTGQEGLCMFAIDCLKANGTHLGTCIDRFYFGSCCQISDKSTITHIVANNIEDNSIDSANFVHPLTEDKIHSTVNKISDNALLNKDKTEVPKVDVTPTEKNEITTNKPATVKDITDPDKVETKSDELTTFNHIIKDDVKSTNAMYTTTKEATTESIKVSHITETIELPIKLSTFQSVSGENNNVVTEKTEPKPTIPETTEVTSIKPTRKPTKPSYKPRPPYRPNNFTRPSISPKPRPTKPTIPFNTTRKPPYRPPPKRPSTKKPLPSPPRLNITIIPQSTSPRPVFTRPIVGTITYINSTGSKVEERPVTTTTSTTTTTTTTITAPTTTTTTTTPLPTSTTTSTPSTTSSTTPSTTTTTTTTTTAKPTTTTTTTTTTTETIPLITEHITEITETVVSETLTNNEVLIERITEKPTDRITERITELQSETTESMQIVTQNDATVVTENDTFQDKVTEKDILKPATEAEIQETTKPATETEVPVTTKPASDAENHLTNKPTTEIQEALATSSEASSKPPESTTSADEWSPITPPEGWILISTISPKPETTKPQTTQNPTEVPDTTEAAKTTVSEAPSTSTTTASPTSEMEFVVNITLSPTAPTTTSSMGLTNVSLNQTLTTTSKPIEDTTTANVTSSTEVPTTITTTTESYNMSNYKEVCGRRMWPQARIVGGAKSGFGQWPWQISLRQYRTSTYLHKCGAALLNENWAITAAHCVERVPPSELLVRLGEYDLANEEEPYGFAERRVQIVASHPHFDPATFEYDLALLRFYEPVTFQPNILPVCVPDDDDDYVGRTAYVTGWGRLYDEGPLPSVLQEVEVPVINNTACESMYLAAGYNEHIPNIFICAGWKKGGSDSCEGDSGGPMVVQRTKDDRFVLSGIISWGIGCAEPNQPGVYTRISEFRDWINQILQF